MHLPAKHGCAVSNCANCRVVDSQVKTKARLCTLDEDTQERIAKNTTEVELKKEWSEKNDEIGS